MFPFSGSSWFPIEHKVAWDEAYLHTKWHLSPSSRLATADIGRKLGAVPLWGSGSCLTYCSQPRIALAIAEEKVIFIRKLETLHGPF